MKNYKYLYTFEGRKNVEQYFEGRRQNCEKQFVRETNLKMTY